MTDLPEKKDDDLLPQKDDLPPVVARIVVEVRSDGTRTVARGGMEDRVTGQKVALQAEAATPLELSRLLLRSIIDMPRQMLRDALGGGRLRDRVGRALRGLPGPGDE